MTQSVVWPPIGGTSYSVPEASEEDWAVLTNYLVALSGAQGTTAQKWAARTAITSPVTVSSPSDCLVGVNRTVAGPTIVNLPVGVVGQVFVIADMKGDAATNQITVTPNGAQTIAAAATYPININKGAVGLVFTGAGNWSVIFQSTTGAGGAVARATIAAGTPGYNIFNDDTTGLLSEEQFVNAVRGGLGVNASAFTGYLKASAGVFSASAIAAADLPTGIDAAKIGDGSVSTSEFQFINSLTSNAQTQLNAKLTPNAPITPGTAPKITYDANGLVTAGSALAASDMPTGIDAAKIGTGVVSNAEFAFIDGVTSAIQTQIDGKVTGQASSVDNEIALFSGTTGKLIKRASGTGIAVMTAGVLAAATFDNITPAQASNAGKALITSGTTASWQAILQAYGVAVITANPSPAIVNTQYLANTTSAAFSITLPTGVTGDKIKIQDGRGTWDTNNLTIVPATGQRIWPLAINTSLVCNVVRGWIELIYDGAGWSPNSLASTTLGSGSGLIGIPATTTTAAINGVMYECDTTSAGFTLTLPSGTSAAVVGILDAGPFFTTNNLVVAPSTGQSIDTGAANDTITFDGNRQSCIFYRANGSSVWEIQTASQTAYAPGFTPGYTGSTAISAGNIGEQSLTNSAGVAVTTSANYITLASKLLQPGLYLVSGVGALSIGTMTGLTQSYVGISLTTNAVDSASANNLVIIPYTTTPTNLVQYHATPTRYVFVPFGTTQTVFLVGRCNYTAVGSANWDTTSAIQTVRLA